MKLELGRIVTPLSPRTYTEELILCRRYYRRIGNNCRTQFSIQKFNNCYTLFFYESYEGMRITPTCSMLHTNVTEIPLHFSRLSYHNADLQEIYWVKNNIVHFGLGYSIDSGIMPDSLASTAIGDYIQILDDVLEADAEIY